VSVWACRYFDILTAIFGSDVAVDLELTQRLRSTGKKAKNLNQVPQHNTKWCFSD
jgi:hypothetical protein